MRDHIYFVYKYMMLKKIIHIIALILFPFCNFAQNCLLHEISLQQKVQYSSFIIEGQIIDQHSVWNKDHTNIYTIHTIEIYKIFRKTALKPQIKGNYIKLITPGGIVGNEMVKVYPSLELEIGDVGIFFINPQGFQNLAGLNGLLFEPYAGPQGFFRYNLKEGSASAPFQFYENIDDLYQDLVPVKSGQKGYIKIQKFNWKSNIKKTKNNNKILQPVIVNFTPNPITAGTKTILTITGLNFGASKGTGKVLFKDANYGGSLNTVPLSSQYLNWSDTLIEVYVPTRAGTGIIMVQNSSGQNGTSSSILTIDYSQLNVITGGIAYQPDHVDDNGTGGYTWQMEVDFANNISAKQSFERALETWRCQTLINWDVGNSTPVDAIGKDGINIVRFDNGSELPLGVLGVNYSFWSYCGEWYVDELDIIFNDGTNWQFGPVLPISGQYDFETVALHELGHGHQLGHIIASSKVMHYALGSGSAKRILDPVSDIAGGLYVMSQSTVANSCGPGQMNALNSSNCTINAPMANFTVDFDYICPGVTVNFTDLSSNNPTSWSWSFPGGAPVTSTAQNPSITYSASGVYEVILIVTNANGSDTLTETSYITVALPTGVLSGSATIIVGGTATLTINLTGTPPWSIIYDDGVTTITINGITTTPYYFTVSPTDTTTYTLSAVSDSNCAGTPSGNATVNVIFPETSCPNIITYQKISDTQGNFTGILTNSDLFGRDVDSLGDLDGDGVIDLVVGAVLDDDGGTNRGAVWILFLNTNGTVKSYQKISDTQGNFTGILNNEDRFGVSVAVLGDLDGDNIEDIAVGAYRDDDGGLNRGAVWILFLNSNGTVKSYQKISLTQGNFNGILNYDNYFGASITSLGDIDGDGIKDIAVGALYDDDGGTDKGAVWILFLNTNGTVKLHQKISDTQGNFTGTLDNADGFGGSVCTVGDLDGDGINDIAVGTWRDDDGGTNRGAVWILFLNANGTVKSYQKISDTQGNFTGIINDNDIFGVSVTALGDLDGDGVTDLEVGAHDDDGGIDKGAVWILYLNSNGTVKSFLKISNTQSNFSGILDNSDFFGTSVASVGDLDGNGIADIAVGATGDDDGGTDRGAVWILFLQDTCDVPLPPPPSCPSVNTYQKISDTQGNFTGILDNSDMFGFSMDSIGDLDGDGITDMVVSAYRDDDGGTDRGAVWILFLNANGTVKSQQKISDTQGNFIGILDNNDFFGHGVAKIGDLDGDGIYDIVVGAHWDDDGGTDRGAVWILFLNTNGTVKSYQKISDTQGNFSGILNNSDNFGASVGYLGDLDGDSVTDIAVGAFRDNDGGFDRGAVWILFLNSNGTVKSYQKISDVQGNFTGILDDSDLFGRSVSSIGDLDGDSILDIVVSATLDDDGGLDKGAVWILFLNINGTVKSYQKISNTQGNFTGNLDVSDIFGISVKSTGDLDGDNVLDIIVGGNADDDGGTDRGAIWILYLNTNGTVKSYLKISNTQGNFSGILDNSDNFGISVASLGDLNGDGRTDIAIGARFDDDGGTDRGALWILFLEDTCAVPLPPPPPFCPSVNTHQKISDTQGNFTGILDNSDFFGRSIALLDDIDGDGITDIAVGAALDDDGGTNRGAVWILLLNSNGTVKSHQKISDTQGNFTGILDDWDEFGISCATLGDFDYDGNTDIIVGAQYDDDGGYNRGAVWILFLNSNGTVKSHQKISDISGSFTGVLNNEDWFGCSVTTLGDLDGDSITDVAVGAWGDDDGGSGKGAIWILFLNANGTVKSYQKISNTAGLFSGILNNLDHFGISVARIGDLDGDNIAEIAVSAPYDDDGGTDRGAVWILFLNSNGTVKSYQKISSTSGFLTGILDNGDFFGFSVTSIGDLDGDNIIDIAVGSRYDDDGGIDKGSVWILFLNADGTVKSHQKISNTTGNFTGILNDVDQFGLSLTSMGDIDGDGIVEIAVGTTGDDDGGFDRGAVWILFLEDTCVSQTTCNITSSFTVNDTLICDSTTLFFINISTGATEYEWQLNSVFYDTSANVSITFDTAGVYAVTLIAKESLCLDTFSKTITVIPNLIAYAWPDTILCLYDSVQLYASAGTSHVWIPSAGLNDTLIPDPIAFPDTTTIYKVIIGGTGCEQDTAYVTVSVNPLPLANAGTDEKICFGDSVQLTGSGGGAAFYWSPGISLNDSIIANPIASPANTTTYQLTIIDSNNCAGQDSVKITVLPELLLNVNPATICIGDSVVFIASGGQSYLWTLEITPTDTISTDSSITVNPISTTLYLITAFDSTCQRTDTVLVAINPLPDVYAYPDTTINPGASVQLNAGGGVSYQWSPGTGLSDSTKQNPVATPEQTTTWWVTVTDSNGCQNMASVTIFITGCLPPIAGFSFTNSNLTVIFSDSSLNAESLFWNFGDLSFDTTRNPIHTFIDTGTYNVCLNTFNSCGSNIFCDFVSVCNLPAANFSYSEYNLTVSFSDSSSNAITWYWNFDDGATDIIQSPTHIYADSGSYNVCLIAVNTCGTDTFCTFVIAKVIEKYLFIPSAFSPNGDGENDMFKVIGKGINTFYLAVYNRWGEKVFETNDKDKGWDGKHRGKGQGLSVFVYYVVVEFVDGKKETRKGDVTLLR